MSGGSLNYLHLREPDELFEQLDDLEKVEKELVAQGHIDIAQDVRRLIEYILTAENRIRVLAGNLKEVFHAVEWWLSGDYGDACLQNAIEKYRRS